MQTPHGMTLHDEVRKRTALKKIISIRVWCLATAASTIAIATSSGLSVLGVGV
jgi:hypothetical protein